MEKEHRSPYWCFTSYDDEGPEIDLNLVTYLVFQKETCPETKKEHWQGYVEFKNRKRFKQVKEILGDTCHIEPRRGNGQQASDYCKKTETAIAGTQYEYGELTIPATNGIDAVKKFIDEGATEIEIADQHFGTYIRYGRGIRDYLMMKRIAKIPSGYKPIDVWVGWGKPGTGKTKFVEELAKQSGTPLYRLDMGQGERTWWDNYNMEPWLLLDDYEGQIDRTRFLKLTGGYGHLQQWPIKGGFTRILFTRIFITSNKNPEDWYPFLDTYQKGALQRRLTKIQKFE